MAELIEPFGGEPHEARLMPRLSLASPFGYSFTRGLGRATADKLRVSCSLPGVRAQDGSEPGAVKSKLEERIMQTTRMLDFPRPGTAGAFLDTRRVPKAEAQLWDRTEGLAFSSRTMHVDGLLQLQQYESAHAALSDVEKKYEDLTVEHAMTVDAVADAMLNLAEAKLRIHRKQLHLAHLRRNNFDKVTTEADAMAELKQNNAWLASKHSKFALQREVARLERQLLTWRKSADSEFRACKVQLDKAVQEEQRQQAILRTLQHDITDSHERVEAMLTALKILSEEPDGDAGHFGWFVDEDADILPGLNSLRVDIQKLDGLESRSKIHAFTRLEARYQHLRLLSSETKRINAAAQAFRADPKLNSAIFAIQQQMTEVLESSSVRLLLMDESGTQLWCIEGAAGEEEQVFLPLDVGLTGECVDELEPVNCPSCPDDDRFDASVDSPAPNLVVNSMLVLPVVHPYQVSKPLGVLQVHNKRGGTQAFSMRDVMVGKLLAEQAAISIKSATELYSWTSRAMLMRRISEMGTSMMAELNLRLLVLYLRRAGGELLKASHFAVYSCSCGDSDGQIRLFPDYGATGAPPVSDSDPVFNLLQAVAKDGMTIAINDVSKDKRYDASAQDAKASRMRTHCLILQPMRSTAGKLTGVLGVFRATKSSQKSAPKAFSWEENEALGMLAAVASVALENAWMASTLSGSSGRVSSFLQKNNHSSLQEATPRILSGLNEDVPCKLVRIFLRVRDTSEVWVLDSIAVGKDAHATPVRRPLEGDVKAAFKNRRVSVTQIGGTPLRAASLGLSKDPSILGGSTRKRAPPAQKKRSVLMAEPLPMTHRKEDEGGEFADLEDDIKYVLTAPAYDLTGQVVAVVQLVNKVDGLPFTHQDEYFLRGAASEVVMMIETAQQATEANTAESNLGSVISIVACLGSSITSSPGEAAFDTWLQSKLMETVVCDSFEAFWLDLTDQEHLVSGKGDVIPVSEEETVPPPPTPALSSPATGNSAQHIQAAFLEGKTVVLSGVPSHIMVPVLSHSQAGSSCFGVFHLHGGTKRYNATGGYTFSSADRRFVEDVAAHVGVYIDMHVIPSLPSFRSLTMNRSKSIRKLV